MHGAATRPFGGEAQLVATFSESGGAHITRSGLIACKQRAIDPQSDAAGKNSPAAAAAAVVERLYVGRYAQALRVE